MKKEELKAVIAKYDDQTKSKKVKKGAITVTYLPETGAWYEKAATAESKTKGKKYMSLEAAIKAMKASSEKKGGFDIDVAVLVKSRENAEGVMTTWLIASEPEIDEYGNAKYETVHIQLSHPEANACDERIAFYDGYYLYPLTKESHCTVGRILGLSGQFDSVCETAVLPLGLALVMSENLMKKGPLNLVYSTRRSTFKKVRPLMGMSLMKQENRLSHEKVFDVMEKALSAHCVWNVSSYEISEQSITVQCDITYPFKGRSVLHDGCVPGEGATFGVDILDGEAVMRAGSASFGHASKDSTAFEKISQAVKDGEEFALEYQGRRNGYTVFAPECAEGVFSCIGKQRKQKSSGMSFTQGTVSELMNETVRAYGTNELNTYKEGKLFEAYAEEARNLMKAVKAHD